MISLNTAYLLIIYHKLSAILYSIVFIILYVIIGYISTLQIANLVCSYFMSHRRTADKMAAVGNRSSTQNHSTYIIKFSLLTLRRSLKFFDCPPDSNASTITVCMPPYALVSHSIQHPLSLCRHCTCLTLIFYVTYFMSHLTHP